jgi:hypothetical protein
MQIKDMTMTDMVTLVLDKKQLKKDLKKSKSWGLRGGQAIIQKR